MTKLTVTHDLQLRGALLRFVARTLPLTHPSGKKPNSKTTLDEIIRRVSKMGEDVDVCGTTTTASDPGDDNCDNNGGNLDNQLAGDGRRR